MVSHPPALTFCVFTNENNQDRLILAIHIDDGLINATNQSSIKKLLAELRKEFEVTSNEINTYLGLQIERLADPYFCIRRLILKKFYNDFGWKMLTQ